MEPARGGAPSRASCSVVGCDRSHYARGLCNLHWQRTRRNGSTESTIPARGTGRTEHDGYVLVYRPGHVLAQRNGWVREHRLVAWTAGLLTDPSMEVHHINENTLDNRLENLEVHATHADHMRRHIVASTEPCLDCQRPRPDGTAKGWGRGLCPACYQRHAYHGTLTEWPLRRSSA